MTGLILQKINFFCSLFILNQFSIFDFLLQNFLLFLQFLQSLLQSFLPFLQLFNLCFKLRRPLLRLQLLSHRKSKRTFIQSLIRLNSHIKLIPNPHQKYASLCWIYGNLPDNLIKALVMELLPNRTDPWISILWSEWWVPGLPIDQFLIKHLLQSIDILTGRRIRTDNFLIIFAIRFVSDRREHRIQQL